MQELKDKVLALLYDHALNSKTRGRGEYLSGEEAAQSLHVSRNAVWKAIEELREDGCPLDAASRKGYRLTAAVPYLSAVAINAHLGRFHPITVLTETDSTNKQLMRMADEGAEEGTIVIAESQTEGRGRLGRQFISPPGTGIYMSFLLRPKSSAAQAVRITTAAAVAVADAIETCTGEKTAIKWVNDIFIRGKKVCGILTEGAVDVESGGMRYAVLGIGINVCPPMEGFPPELAEIAGCVTHRYIPELRNKLAAVVIGNFFREYNRWNYRDPAQSERIHDDPCYLSYRRRMFLLGKLVKILPIGAADARVEYGVCVDLDRDYRLIVEVEENGKKVRRTLSSGEVSVLPTQQSREANEQ